jgi:copper(I)-binding protein
MSFSHTNLFAAMIAAANGCFGFVSPARAAPPPGFIRVADFDVMVHEAWARATPGASTTGAAYVMLMGGSKPDQLVGVSTPVAAMAQVHETTDDHGVMKMRSVDTVPIPPNGMVTFAPGGYHIMLTGLKQPLVAGQSFPLTLTFAHAAPVTVDVKVRPLGRDAPMGGHDHMHM